MKNLLVILLMMLPSIQEAHAYGDASSAMQVVQNLQVIEVYKRQLEELQEAQKTVAAALKNLEQHPLGNIWPELDVVLGNQARVMTLGSDIGNTMTTVASQFESKFKDHIKKSFADKFKSWTDTATDALKTSMLTAGLQREKFKDDEAALKALAAKNHASDGNLGAIKTLAEINVAQVQEIQKLRDLLTQNQLATNQVLAAQVSQRQAEATSVQDELNRTMTIEDRPFPPPRPKTKTTW